MGDRTDIDALLISALYGELAPADEARLTAHLESHPADRVALADLTQTRAAVRESRLLAVQLEPPQSVSALLLQEAARRAPRKARERDQEGWFQRFVRSLTAHPAMAAAMTLVLIVGVASTLYVRNADDFGKSESPQMAKVTATESATARPAPAAGSAASPSPPGASPAGGDGAAPADPQVTGKLADNVAPPAQAAAPPAAPAATPAEGSYRVGLAEATGGKAKGDGDRYKLAPASDAPADTTLRAAAPDLAAAPAKRAKQTAGISLERREMMPKELDDEQEARKAGRFDRDQLAQAPSGAAGGAAPPKPQPAPATIVPEADVAYAKHAPAKEAVVTKPSATSAVAPSPAPAAVASADGASVARDWRGASSPAEVGADEKTSDKRMAKDAEPRADKALIGWAQKQRDQVIAYVRANNCRAAASTATEIYNRAPDYYAANVEIDRTIKPCLAYVTSERERSERVKAAVKRANAADSQGGSSSSTPAAPAPPPPVRK